MSTIAFPARRDAPPVLSIENLNLAYRLRDGWRRVVHDVSLTVGGGEVVALVGESGSGKTTMAQAVIGLLPGNGRVRRHSPQRHRHRGLVRTPARRDPRQGHEPGAAGPRHLA